MNTTTNPANKTSIPTQDNSQLEKFKGAAQSIQCKIEWLYQTAFSIEVGSLGLEIAQVYIALQNMMDDIEELHRIYDTAQMTQVTGEDADANLHSLICCSKMVLHTSDKPGEFWGLASPFLELHKKAKRINEQANTMTLNSSQGLEGNVILEMDNINPIDPPCLTQNDYIQLASEKSQQLEALSVVLLDRPSNKTSDRDNGMFEFPCFRMAVDILASLEATINAARIDWNSMPVGDSRKGIGGLMLTLKVLLQGCVELNTEENITAEYLDLDGPIYRVWEVASDLQEEIFQLNHIQTN